MVIPWQGHDAVFTGLHKGNPGMTMINELSRKYVWWPGLNMTSKIV